MRKFFQSFLPIIFLLPFVPIQQPETAFAEETLNADGVIVKYIEKNDEPVSDLIEVVDIPIGETTDTLIEKLEDQKKVEYAEPNYLFKKMGSATDPLLIKQWHHQKIGTKTAWKKTMGSNEVVVAIIDDGIDRNHEDLKGQIYKGYDTVRERKNILPKGEHGTHVAGIIAGSANNHVGGTGVAPSIKIMPINVFDGLYADTVDIIEAIHYAVKNGANIINMSLGETYYSKALNNAVQEAYQKGVLIIAASGNEGDMKKSNMRVYPAAFSHVISVGATTSKDKRATYSNYDSSVDITAPGDKILSTFPNNDYAYMSGTSMATPVVSGVAALIWSNEPKLSRSAVEYRLYDSAVDLGTKGKDVYYGNGRVNAKKALEMKTLSKPSVTTISDKDTKIKGTIPSTFKTGTVSIYTSEKTLATVKINGEKTFSATIGKQKANQKIHIRVVDKTGNKSVPITLTVSDKTAPSTPIVNKITPKTTKVTGKAEAGSTVYIQASNKVIGSAKANSKGMFTVKIPKQSVGKILYVYAKDVAKNTSKSRKLTVKK
ncbi:S8 family serine peptidase [Peribacillus sp. NPDC097675]|uniref:S8 family serine peptidase n=1 Tax=Peribacillus sp. NPDC097675 TaxID=3390618 RepID=UPI003CFF1C7A